jgi:hypothetical protein
MTRSITSALGKGVGGKIFFAISPKFPAKSTKKSNQIHKNDNSYTTNFHKKLNQIFVSFLNQNEN